MNQNNFEIYILSWFRFESSCDGVSYQVYFFKKHVFWGVLSRIEQGAIMSLAWISTSSSAVVKFEILTFSSIEIKISSSKCTRQLFLIPPQGHKMRRTIPRYENILMSLKRVPQTPTYAFVVVFVNSVSTSTKDSQ